VKITIIGKPIHKIRHRYSVRSGHVVTYDPQSKEKEATKQEIMRQVSELIRSDDKELSLEACNLSSSKAFAVCWSFYLPVPQSDTTSQKNAKLWGIEAATCKPDYDNLEKFYLDCANGIIWPDDRMIVRSYAEKIYDEEPRMELTVGEFKTRELPDNARKLLTLFSPSEFDQLANEVKDLSIELESFSKLREASYDQTYVKIIWQLTGFVAKYATVFKKIEKLAKGIEEEKERYFIGKTLC
jgi:Holliday junction resolvase RusA-like endonuclease